MHAIEVDRVGKTFKLRQDRAVTVQELILGRIAGRIRTPRTFHALRDVSFDVAPGSALGIIGHNGAGKSTLLRLLCGLGRPTTGHIRRTGNVSGLLDLGKGFHPDMTGRENLRTGAILNGLAPREIDAREGEIIAFAELEEFIDQPVRTYSQGMYLRLAFATAIDLDPEVLVIDEVLAVGDQRFQKKCLDRLAAFRASGKTMILASHDCKQIARMCDEVLVLEEGRLAMKGPPDRAIACYDRLMWQRTERRAALFSQGAPLKSGRPAGEGMRTGSGEASLEAIAIRGGQGTQTGCVACGSPLNIELGYRLTAGIKDAALILGIYTDLDTKCFETFLPSLSEELGPLSVDGMIRCEIPALPLLPGRYNISAGLFPSDWNHAYDYQWNMISFLVEPGDVATQRDSGVVALRPVWRLAKRHAPQSGGEKAVP